MRYENVVADLAHETRRTLAALDVRWDEATLQFQALRGKKQVRSPSYEEIARPIYTTSIGRWRNYERQLAPMMERLMPLIEKLGYGT